MFSPRFLSIGLIPLLAASVLTPVAAQLPGETPAQTILDDASAKARKGIEFPVNLQGLDASRLGKVPAPGVHPRVLISPDQLPDLRRRLKETNVGQALYATLRKRLDQSLRNPSYWGGELYKRLAAGDAKGADALVREKGAMPPGIGHYQPFLYAIVLEAFDALITEDSVRGAAAAKAVATYAALARPGIEAALAAPLGDDVWRASDPGAAARGGIGGQPMRELLGGQLLGYAYDFSAPFMSEADRDAVRSTIAVATAGRIWMGGRLPEHFRNWNWIAVGLQQPLLALSIEGEEGYDPRVYDLGVEIARDYLNYGISAKGVSTEAVGYTQFGLVWANPFFVAAQRRGANLLGHEHHRAMLDWYLQTLVPSRTEWLSHGDGGDRGPAIWTLSMWRYFYPNDPKARALWSSLMTAEGSKALDGNFHLVEALVWCSDDPNLGKPLPEDGSDLLAAGVPPVMFDPERGSLSARSGWGKDAAFVQFECRTDSVGGSHEHADRGMFTLAALGRVWAKDNFRSVETRHHNNILIDGLGQGFWPGPGVWLGLQEFGDLLIAACDAKDAYSWFWPKQILTENPDSFERFKHPRWQSYREGASLFQKQVAGLRAEKETRPAVEKFWSGYEKGDPRLWDEDARPVRFPHNPVVRAFRTIAFDRGKNPWLLVVDDIQKDDSERLYEWLMQTGQNTEIASISGNDIILCDATVARNADGVVTPKTGDRQLLVRILELKDPAQSLAYTSRPSVRLETFERRDTLAPESSGLSGSRSFGLDKRLVIPSRSAAPDFKMLLYPFRKGDPLPKTTWSDDRSSLTIETPASKTMLSMRTQKDGRTAVAPLSK